MRALASMSSGANGAENPPTVRQRKRLPETDGPRAAIQPPPETSRPPAGVGLPTNETAFQVGPPGGPTSASTAGSSTR